jgi:hypothetical protein
MQYKILIQAPGVLCRYKMNVVFITSMLLAPPPLIPDGKQQHQQKALLGFSIVQFLRNLIRRNIRHFPPSDMTAVTPLNKFRRSVRSSQFLCYVLYALLVRHMENPCKHNYLVRTSQRTQHKAKQTTMCKWGRLSG